MVVAELGCFESLIATMKWAKQMRLEAGGIACQKLDASRCLEIFEKVEMLDPRHEGLDPTRSLV